MKFMCPHHRDETLSTPSQAVDQWNVWMDRGIYLLEMGDLEQATRLLGCSFEIGQWLLNKPEVVSFDDEPCYLDRYMIAGHHLGECFGRKGEHNIELHLLLSIHSTLLRMVSNPIKPHWDVRSKINLSMTMISRFQMQRGKIRGYEDLVEETQSLLKCALH